ncbi:protein phosphatase 2C domain-containing protein [Desulfobotulus sp. H1]|uniref:Protein phosphatase 2C domain-containing protein n=1 Tax=Desulfobotulus pelophilus TaxID=2823377 RepID=A0ABT3NA69_9BACT|nr:protein phosphatase 2C domain-containing protein [Desulfobotulus pelophilus]
MEFRISYILEKGTGALNEDAISLNGTTFGVFDGATSLCGRRFENGVTGGFLASHTAKEIFTTGKGTLKFLAGEANGAIRENMLAHQVDMSDRASLWSTSAAVVQMDSDRMHWIQIGDSLILFVHKDGSFSVPVKNVDHDAETLSMWKSMAGKTEQTIMEALGDQIRRVRSRMNRDYGVLNGEPCFISFLNQGTADLKDIAHVLIFTDGLFIPTEDPSITCFDAMADLFQMGGLPAVRDYVRELEASDPDCVRYPRFKTHDDMGAVALRIIE